MKVLRSRWLARLAGCTALTFGMAAVAAATPAHARATGIIFQSRVVASWGDNYYGELGDGTTTDRSRYGDINALSNDMVQVSAGYHSGLALRGDGTVWAWGDNGAGQLGDGTTTSQSTPVQVTGLTGVTQVAAGEGFSLALRSDGTVWAWGGNGIGQLGHGTTSDRELAPVQVTGLAGVTKISAGGYFSLALRSDGTVWAWGYNLYGQLGNGTTVSSSVPVKVTGLTHATGIAAGYDAAVATQTNGITVLASVWTWGGNSSGQLGDGTLTGHSTPERVAGINNLYLAGVTAGPFTAAVLGTDGSVWSWGNDTAGQLGNAPASSPVTRPVNTIAAGSRITQLSAGWGHMLALRSDGTVLAWGSNTGGQLGIGNTAPVAGPVQVTGLTAVSQVSAGGRAFSLAVHTAPWLVKQSS
jgi:alpha-tubulin suppressor-like RCC1 family protein